MVVVKNRDGPSSLGTLESAGSQKWVDEMSWIFACSYKFRKTKIYLNNNWQGMVKNGRGLIDHVTLKSGVSRKWFDKLSRLIEWFLHADSDGIIFDLTAIYSVSLTFINAGGPLQLYLARVSYFEWPQDSVFSLFWNILLGHALTFTRKKSEAVRTCSV